MKQLFKKIIVLIITLLARAVLHKYKPEIVAITGSVGKTGAKDATWTVLSREMYVWKGDKSFNSEIGIPLTVLGCESAWGNVIRWLKIIFEGLSLIFLKNHYPKMLVVEVGTDRPGDIQKITSWLKPDVVVVTAFPEIPVHIEFFPSREALIEEKTHLVRALKPAGLLVLNADDRDVLALKQFSLHNTLTFGETLNADISILNPEIEYDREEHPVGMFGKVSYKENKLPLHLKGVLGTHIFLSVLASLAVGVGKGVNIVSALEALAQFQFPAGRMRLLHGINGSTIIDDSYNSSPAALHAALNALESLTVPTKEQSAEGGRKIAVLGDMLELGKYSADEHKKIGARIPDVCGVLITVGIRAQLINESALKKKMKKADTHHFENSIEAGEFLKTFLRSGDIVLVKGSQSMRMERVVERILENLADTKFLARQESAWLSR
ncbi:MAG: hypothetical protein HYT93_00450 [Parcubacteria group bacterium]|nr:hypothetical protein [Parcubacteria group bacterium]